MSSSRIIPLNDGLYQYETPKPPDNEIDIWYYNVRKKSDQYWKTPANVDLRWLDRNGVLKDVKKMPERDRINYINYWRDKWENGLWFFNNGEPTYITGMHVDHLVFNQFSGHHLFYLNSQRERFYFRDITNNDPVCDGRVWIKPRRAGITIEEITESIRAILSDTYNNVIFQSDTYKKVMDTLMKPTIDVYSRRPAWMREEFYAPQGRKPASELSLTSSTMEDQGLERLGGKIEGLPTVASAGDGKDYVLSVIDEFSKNESCSPYEILEVNLKAINPFKQLKIDCLSTTGDSKNSMRATMDWHKLIANSNPKILNKNGKTISGLKKYFVNAIDSLFVYQQIKKQTGKSIIDNHGYVNKEMAEEWIWNEHNKYEKNSQEYFFSLYKLPLEESHALLSSSVSNIFRKPAIVQRLHELEELPFDKKPYVRGDLVEDQQGLIHFEPSETGIWLWAVQPYFSTEKAIDTRNRFRRIDGVFFPPINPEGCFGYDPINFPKDMLKTNKYSKACITGHKKFDYYGSGIKDEKMCFLLWRPDDPHDVNTEMIKACKFTGYPCSHERSIAHVYEDFKAANMLPFLMKFDGHYGIVANSKNTGDGLAMMQARYSNPKTPEQKDQIATHPFEDALRSHRDFDPSNTNQFDPTMSEIMLEHGLKQIVYTNASDQSVGQLMDRIHVVMPPRRHLVR